MNEVLDLQIATKKAELKELEQLIAERNSYYNQQESLISELIEQGNTKLMELTHDVMLAKKELREIKTDIRTSANDKVLLMRDIKVLQIQISTYM